MTPAGLHQSCLIPLIERGIVSALTTTGANLYHDAHRIIGHAIREVNPNAGDLLLRLDDPDGPDVGADGAALLVIRMAAGLFHAQTIMTGKRLRFSTILNYVRNVL